MCGGVDERNADLMFGLTTKIQGFVLTRDSWLWTYAKVLGLASAITTGAIDPASFGLTAKQKQIVMVVCGVIVTVAAQLSTSPLPSKVDAAKVKE